MAAADLKARLETFIAEQQKDLARLESEYLIEKGRMTTQIASAQAVLAKWDKNLEGVIDGLAVAGIQVRTN